MLLILRLKYYFCLHFFSHSSIDRFAVQARDGKFNNVSQIKVIVYISNAPSLKFHSSFKVLHFNKFVAGAISVFQLFRLNLSANY